LIPDAFMNDIQNRFDYHPPKDEYVKTQHEDVRAACKYVAEFFGDTLPEGREKALAMTKLEEAMFWANAAIARWEGNIAHKPDCAILTVEFPPGPHANKGPVVCDCGAQ
jgi:hypothetical protein